MNQGLIEITPATPVYGVHVYAPDGTSMGWLTLESGEIYSTPFHRIAYAMADRHKKKHYCHLNEDKAPKCLACQFGEFGEPLPLTSQP
jgi:hypothetical protein